MQKVAEYEKHATTCRQMATKTTNQNRKQQLLQMAETWDRLAGERRVQLSARDGSEAVIVCEVEGVLGPFSISPGPLKSDR